MTEKIKLRKDGTPESQPKRKGRQICTRLGAYHFPAYQAEGSKRGRGDDVVCYQGQYISIEYKDDMQWGKHTKEAYRSLPSMHQVLRMEECRKAGGITLLVDRNNIDQLEDCLKLIISRRELAKNMHLQGVEDWPTSIGPLYGSCFFNMTSREFAEYRMGIEK